MKMNLIEIRNQYVENECIDHPLGILCRCKEYREIIDKFVINTIGTLNLKNSNKIVIEEPVASAEVHWTLRKAETNQNPTKPFLLYKNIEKSTNIHENNVDKSWIPVNINLVSAKELRPNTSYRHRTAQNTQSADICVLTDMLPHHGRSVKRRDIDWDIGSHKTSVEMTDEPETNFSLYKGCFSTWAENYTISTGRSAY